MWYYKKILLLRILPIISVGTFSYLASILKNLFVYANNKNSRIDVNFMISVTI